MGSFADKSLREPILAESGTAGQTPRAAFGSDLSLFPDAASPLPRVDKPPGLGSQ